MICLILFRNGHLHNVVSTFANVVHINIENDNVVSTLSNIAYINVEIHNTLPKIHRSVLCKITIDLLYF